MWFVVSRSWNHSIMIPTSLTKVVHHPPISLTKVVHHAHSCPHLRVLRRLAEKELDRINRKRNIIFREAVAALLQILEQLEKHNLQLKQRVRNRSSFNATDVSKHTKNTNSLCCWIFSRGFMID